MAMEAAELRDGGRLKDIRAFIDSLYDRDLHTKARLKNYRSGRAVLV
jgi:hypothetical protein